MSAYYVSTSGADATGDGSVAHPFATLARAQSAMEASTTKTTYLEAGVYALSSTVTLGSADDGDTIASAPGQVAVLDGRSSLATLVKLDTTSGVTVSGLAFENAQGGATSDTGALTLHNAGGDVITGNTFSASGSDAILIVGSTSNTVVGNTIENSAANGVEDQDGGSANSFTNNVIDGVASTDTNGGGFYLHGTTNEVISHNLVENTQGSGIVLVAMGGYNGQPVLVRNTGTTVSDNMVSATGGHSTDSGAIYVLDRTGQDTGITISNNEVNGTGQGPYVGGIYLDDYTSGVTVSSNIVRGVSARDIQLHGGRNISVTNNILDLGTDTNYAVLLQGPPSNVTPNTGSQGATNDSLSGNIIVSVQPSPVAYVNYDLALLPSVFNNLYYDPAGQFPTEMDASPRTGNPAFADPLDNNYVLGAASAASSIGFIPIDQAAIGPMVPSAAGPAPISVGSGPDRIVLAVSEDAWQGDAQFTVTLDGQQIGGILATTASHSAGQVQDVILAGTFSADSHVLGVDFINDAWGGTASTDRNLYVNSITANGVTVVENAAQDHGGTGTYATPVGGATSDQLVAYLSEDDWQGDAQATISVDGRQVAGPFGVTALHSAGATQAVAIDGNWGSGSHTIGVTFLNDAYGGTAASDRNLYVNAVSYDGAFRTLNTVQAANGTTNVAISAAAPIGSGPDQVTVGISEDAWMGDAQATISVDGTQVAGPLIVTANHALGQSQAIAVNGKWGSGTHTIGVSFINDAYGGSISTDRNLYVTGGSYDGTVLPENIAEYNNGTAVLAVSGTTPGVSSIVAVPAVSGASVTRAVAVPEATTSVRSGQTSLVALAAQASSQLAPSDWVPVGTGSLNGMQPAIITGAGLTHDLLGNSTSAVARSIHTTAAAAITVFPPQVPW